MAKKIFECEQTRPEDARNPSSRMREFDAQWDKDQVWIEAEVTDTSVYFGCVRTMISLSRGDAIAFARWILETAGSETDELCS